MMATDSTHDSLSGTAVQLGDDNTGVPSQSQPAPLAQAQTHSLDIHGKQTQQQQQQQQQPLQHQPLEGDPNSENVSPQELTLYVEKLLEQINAKFDGVSGQILGKMDEMSSRIDDLEKSIGELVQNVEEEPKQLPTPADK
ncbi:hypothetical protein KI688_009275 [Linnemannia hyalina]|uniref:Heat shock factor binding protein 1 n=1 Tax=Linnemannia hyalina TaxID=64524 RepID=A0A9P7Y0E2_9FUNG|nr:hypothetical protein KI688_009275 [Linnemannia hyalina]